MLNKHKRWLTLLNLWKSARNLQREAKNGHVVEGQRLFSVIQRLLPSSITIHVGRNWMRLTWEEGKKRREEKTRSEVVRLTALSWLHAWCRAVPVPSGTFRMYTRRRLESTHGVFSVPHATRNKPLHNHHTPHTPHTPQPPQPPHNVTRRQRQRKQTEREKWRRKRRWKTRWKRRRQKSWCGLMRKASSHKRKLN